MITGTKIVGLAAIDAWRQRVKENKQAFNEYCIKTGKRLDNLEEIISNLKEDGIKVETDPNGKNLNTPGAKADAGKQRSWLVLGNFSSALSAVADVGTFGANKYTANGWVDVPNAQERYMDAAMRHLLKYGSGHALDNGPGGTNCPHIACVIWNLLAVLELEKRNGQLPPAQGHRTSDTK